MNDGTTGRGEAAGSAATTAPAPAAPDFTPRRSANGSIDLKDAETRAWMQARSSAARARAKAERAAAKAQRGKAGGAETAAEQRRRIAEAFDRMLAKRDQDVDWTAARRLAFVTALECWGSVERACEKAEVPTSAAYGLRKCDTGFAQAWSEAMARWRDRLDGALRDATITAYSALAERGGFGERPAVSEKTALFYAQGLRAAGSEGEPASADPRLSGIDAEAEQGELERRLQELAEKMGSPFGDGAARPGTDAPEPAAGDAGKGGDGNGHA